MGTDTLPGIAGGDSEEYDELLGDINIIKQNLIDAFIWMFDISMFQIVLTCINIIIGFPYLIKWAIWGYEMATSGQASPENPALTIFIRVT